MADVENKDPLQDLFEGIESDLLTDSVKLKMSTLFEAAINAAVEAKEAELEESNKEELSTFKEDLIEKTSNYLDFFTTEYIKENEQIVEDFTKVRLAEKVLRNFHQMTEAFNISLSDESISSEDEINSLKTENSKLVNKLIESRKETVSVKKAAVVAEISEKLETEVQKDKLVEMAKKVDFDDELFESKLEVLVGKILGEKTEDNKEKLTEQEETEVPVKTVSPSMGGYLRNL